MIIARATAGLCREAAKDYSPGLQPWVGHAQEPALKVATDEVPFPRASHLHEAPIDMSAKALGNSKSVGRLFRTHFGVPFTQG